MNRKQKITLSITGIILVTLILVGLTYGYYLTTIKGNTNTKSITTSLANLELKYDDGNGTITSSNLEPGSSITKTFSVENTGNREVENYTIYLENVINDFEDKDDLYLTLKCSSTEGDCNGNNMVYPSKDGIIAVNNIQVGEKQSFELIVEFLETNDLQNDNMNKKFEGNVKILDMKSANKKLVSAEGEDKVTVSNPELLTNFKIYGSSIQSNIPTEYQELETIAATQISKGSLTAGFNTGYAWKDVSKIVVTMQFLNTPTNGAMIFKSISSGSEDIYSPYITSKTNNIYFNGISGNVVTDYTMEELTNNGLKTLEINIDTNSIDKFIYFGSWNDTAYSANWQLKNLKIYGINNNLLKDFVPCYRKSDKTTGVCDIINGDFQSNNGTGTFTNGKNLPTPENPIEIRSVGDLVTDTNDSNYGKYKLGIKTTGKNIFDINTYLKEYLNNENGITYTQKNFIQINKIKILADAKENTQYTLSFDYEIYSSDEEKGNAIYVSMRDKNNNELKKVQLTSKGTTVTGTSKIVMNEDTTLSHILISYATGTRDCSVILKNIQLEEGTESTDFEAYEEKTTNIFLDEPLRKVGNYSDYIDLINKKIVRNIKEKIFTGNETYYTKYLPELLFKLTETDYMKYLSSSQTRQMSNYGYDFYPSNSAGSYIGISINKLGYENYEDFLNIIKEKNNEGNPIVSEYILATATEKTLEIPDLELTENIKHIFIESNTKPSNIEIGYIN